jgi:hypothetical protein
VGLRRKRNRRKPTERKVEFTVMATPDDLKVDAEYIRMADRYIEVLAARIITTMLMLISSSI